MKKYITDERTGLKYELVGDYRADIYARKHLDKENRSVQQR